MLKLEFQIITVPFSDYYGDYYTNKRKLENMEQKGWYSRCFIKKYIY